MYQMIQPASEVRELTVVAMHKQLDELTIATMEAIRQRAEAGTFTLESENMTEAVARQLCGRLRAAGYVAHVHKNRRTASWSVNDGLQDEDGDGVKDHYVAIGWRHRPCD
jgi:hypothetical protein